MTPTVHSHPWGFLSTGEEVTLSTLRSGTITAEIMNYGGVLVRLLTPDRDGVLGDIVLGHDRLGPYLDRATSCYFGALVGRYANRVAGGRFTLNHQTYQLDRNDGSNALHGGLKGFDQHLWEARSGTVGEAAWLELRRRSPDGEEGYPGNLDVTVTYRLCPDALEVEYHALTDKPTILNLTQHSYWNLTGDARRDALGHQIRLNAQSYTPVDENLIPTGELAEVGGTPFDLRTSQVLGQALREHAAHPQLVRAGGYDHNFVLCGEEAAALYEPLSGRTLRVHTTQPGVQLYSGNFLDGSVTGKGGQRYGRHWGLCLETQHFPDAPNQAAFPNTVLRPGEVFREKTRFVFGTQG